VQLAATESSEYDESAVNGAIFTTIAHSEASGEPYLPGELRAES